MDKAALDRYLTTEPDSDLDCWIEKTFEAIPEHIWNEHEAFFDEYGGLSNKLLNYMWAINMKEIDASVILSLVAQNKSA